MKVTIKSTQLKTVWAILSKWLVPLIEVDPTKKVQLLKWAAFFVGQVDDMISNNGVKFTANYFKTVRAATLNYIAGTPIYSVESSVKLNKRGLPSVLGPIIDSIDTMQRKELQYLLTLLRVGKLLTIPPEPNLSSITDPYKGAEPHKVFQQKDLSSFFRSLGIARGGLDFRWTRYHLSTKTAPNRDLALNASIAELCGLIPFEEGCQTQSRLFSAIRTLGGKALGNNMSMLRQILGPSLPSEKDTPLRRLTYISDKEAKTRVVAIFDYWSQTALLPLHNALLGILKKMKTDCTFDQDRFTRLKLSPPYICFDLKDATDRFPISFQKEVLSYAIGKERAEAWADILIQEPFVTPEGDQVKYNTGQPMGAYSSWATFALCHHFVVYIAAKRAKKKARFTAYAILGDDIVICDYDVARHYKEIMDELQVIISNLKSFESNEFFEMASRHFLNGEEITGFPLSGLITGSKDIPNIIESIRNVEHHGWDHLIGELGPDQILSLIRIISKAPVYNRTKETIGRLRAFPVKEIWNGILTRPERALQYSTPISCFSNQIVPLVRDAMIIEVINNFESDIEKITDLHTEWAFKTTPMVKEIFSRDQGSGDRPFMPRLVPFMAVWFDLKREVREKINAGLQYLDEPELGLDWAKDYVTLSNMPDIIRCLKERRSAIITSSQSYLILKALKRVERDRPQEMLQGFTPPGGE
jgi:hypothetical protein